MQNVFNKHGKNLAATIETPNTAGGQDKAHFLSYRDSE